MKDLGICILTLKSKEKVLACLISLFENTRDLDMDVVVVDNNSQDGTVEEIRARYPGVRLVVNESNLGYSKAVNQGLRVLDARYYVLLNPDTIVQDLA
ncbi:MAG TPA: glycosyltransferase, partial [Anaerolineales bacterium]|nr:glycosyltransferase [Anaerolineales bacterium]